MVSRIEALADSIARLNGTLDPESDAYKLRNPGLIKSYAMLGRHETDEEGRRIFKSIVNGYKALLFDLEKKMSGTSRTKLTQQSKLEELFAVYGMRRGGMENCVAFIRRALQDMSISMTTPLSFFYEIITSITLEEQ